MGHEAYDGEDDEASEHAGAGVDEAHNDGVPEQKKGPKTPPKHLGLRKKAGRVKFLGGWGEGEVDACPLPVYVVIVSVVAPQRDERTQAQSVGEEDLSRRVQPHLSDTPRRPRLRLFVRMPVRLCVCASV